MNTLKSILLTSLFFNSSFLAAQIENLPNQIIVGNEYAKVRNILNLPDIDGYQLLKCDFHVHTIFSDGIVWPTLRVKEAWEEGLDAIAITDHIEGQPAHPYIHKGHNNSFLTAKEEAARKNIILIRGGEITRSMPPGHLNALFVNDLDALDKPNYIDVLKEAKKQGAFIQWNHPGWGVDSIEWHKEHEMLYKNGLLDGIEVFNEFEWYPKALEWAYEKDLAILGNTDVHDVISRLYNPRETTHRPMTLVLAKERSEDGLKEALFARRTLIYFYDKLMGKEDYLRKFFESSLKIYPAHYSENGRDYITLENASAVPLYLSMKEEVTGYPLKIVIPGNKKTVISVPSERHSASYMVNNFIISPMQLLEVKLF